MKKNLNIKKGDTVLVIAGKDKDKSGKVIKSYPDDERVVVENINVAHKHKKARSVKQQSAIITQESPIHVSNLMLLCNTCKKATRPSIKIAEDGQKIRVCKKCGAEFDK